MRNIKEWQAPDPETFQRDIVPAGQPAVLRGVAADWPVVKAAKISPQAFVEYLKRFYGGRPLHLAAGAPSINGRFFYEGDDVQSVNFERKPANLNVVLDRLLSYWKDLAPPAIAVQAASIPEYLPGFETENPMALVPPGTVPRAWIGNALTVATHFDFNANIACVAAGHRRFTLFPPEQMVNLYVGPLDQTPSGVPISMVELKAPDRGRYPRFEAALEAAQTALLEPGDALYIPYAWWHNVESLDGLNMLVNYWWSGSKHGTPFDSLVHAALVLRNLPPEERDTVRLFFEHYVFGTREDPAAHLTEAQKGILGDPTAEQVMRVKAYLAQAFKR